MSHTAGQHAEALELLIDHGTFVRTLDIGNIEAGSDMTVIDSTDETRDSRVEHPAVFSRGAADAALDAETTAGSYGGQILGANDLEIVGMHEICPLMGGGLRPRKARLFCCRT